MSGAGRPRFSARDETLIGMEIVDEADKYDDLRKLARLKWAERRRRLKLDVEEDSGEES